MQLIFIFFLLPTLFSFQISFEDKRAISKLILFQSLSQVKSTKQVYPNNNQTEQRMIGKEMFFLFPYQIYSFLNKTSPYAQSYIFKKVQYHQVQSQYANQERIVKSKDQFAELFNYLPQCILIKPEADEFIEIIQVAGHENHEYFIIKNKTFIKDIPANKITTDVNVYSMKIHNFLYVISNELDLSVINAKSPSIEVKLEHQIIAKNITDPKELEIIKKAQFFQKLINVQVQIQRVKLDNLFTLERKIVINTPTAQWRVQFNGTFCHLFYLQQFICSTNPFLKTNTKDQQGSKGSLTKLQSLTDKQLTDKQSGDKLPKNINQGDKQSSDKQSIQGDKQSIQGDKQQRQMCLQLKFETVGQTHGPAYFQYFQQKKSLQLQGEITHFDIKTVKDYVLYTIGDIKKYYLVKMINSFWKVLQFKMIDERFQLKFLCLMGKNKIARVEKQIDSDLSQLWIVDYEKMTGISPTTCAVNFTVVKHITKINQNYLIICIQHMICHLINHQCEIVDTIKDTMGPARVYWRIRQSFTQHFLIEYIQGLSLVIADWQYLTEINRIPLIKTKTVNNRTTTLFLFWKSIYNFQVYRRHQKFRSLELERILWPRFRAFFQNHVDIQQMTNRSSEEVANRSSQEVTNSSSEEVANKSSEEVTNKSSEEVANKSSEEVANKSSEEVSYQQFEQREASRINGSTPCYMLYDKSTSRQYMVLNESVDFSVCNVTIQTQSLMVIEMELGSRETKYDIIYCGNKYRKLQFLSQNFHCVEIPSDHQGKPTFKASILLYSYMHYKIYFVRHPLNQSINNITKVNLSRIVKFTVRDLQKEEIQFATQIFFTVMFTLSATLALLICLILCRPACVSLLMYYQIIEQNAQETYPMSYFSLKIKLKKLQTKGYLKYYKKETQSDTAIDQQVCCFCLQEICPQNKLAMLYCRHEFHAQCFDEWAGSEPNTKCPSCRRPFTSQSLLQFQQSESAFKVEVNV